jgi:hypothetical protein
MRKFRGTSRFKGVHWAKNEGKWHSNISHRNRTVGIGYFDTEEDAARAYNRKAVELYGSLCNRAWFDEKNEMHHMSWRYAGGLVADLRGHGENYLDFYCSGGEGQIAPWIAAKLLSLGWRTEPR